jgi:hypothetical protein
MSRRPARFTQADIARAIKAVEQVGARMAVEITLDGTIRIVPSVDKVPADVAPQEEVYL